MIDNSPFPPKSLDERKKALQIAVDNLRQLASELRNAGDDDAAGLVEEPIRHMEQRQDWKLDDDVEIEHLNVDSRIRLDVGKGKHLTLYGNFTYLNCDSTEHHARERALYSCVDEGRPLRLLHDGSLTQFS